MFQFLFHLIKFKSNIKNRRMSQLPKGFCKTKYFLNTPDGSYLVVRGPQGPRGKSSNFYSEKLLNHAIPSGAYNGSASPGTAVSEWSASYTANGGTVQVSVNLSAYAGFTGLTYFYLLRDGVIVDTVQYYFNITASHLTIPTLMAIFPNETGTHTYSVNIGTNIVVDTQDSALMVVNEYS